MYWRVIIATDSQEAMMMLTVIMNVRPSGRLSVEEGLDMLIAGVMATGVITEET